MSSQFAVQLLGSGALAAVFAAIINAIMNRKKLGAEATQIITQAASGVVQNLERQVHAKDAEIDELHAELREIKRRQTDHENEMTDLREALQVHAAWDHRAMRLLDDCREGRRVIQALPPPPPLFPERRHQAG